MQFLTSLHRDLNNSCSTWGKKWIFPWWRHTTVYWKHWCYDATNVATSLKEVCLKTLQYFEIPDRTHQSWLWCVKLHLPLSTNKNLLVFRVLFYQSPSEHQPLTSEVGEFLFGSSDRKNIAFGGFYQLPTMASAAGLIIVKWGQEVQKIPDGDVMNATGTCCRGNSTIWFPVRWARGAAAGSGFTTEDQSGPGNEQAKCWDPWCCLISFRSFHVTASQWFSFRWHLQKLNPDIIEKHIKAFIIRRIQYRMTAIFNFTAENVDSGRSAH